MVCVLVLASGAPWESAALGHLADASGVVVLKRCVDVDDLMATAATGQADVAVVALEAPGLDASAVAHLRRHGVRPVAVVADPGRDDVAARLARLDVHVRVAAAEVGHLPAAVLRAEDLGDTRSRSVAEDPSGGPALGPVAPPSAGGAPPGRRVVAVWGPPGAPGRTTLATAVAAELARRGRSTLLVDADPHAASVAQHLGVLDQVSGVLSAARLAQAGTLPTRLPSACRAVAPHLEVMTGLPRADRWVEVRPGALAEVVEEARAWRDVVLDTGADLAVEALAGQAGQRNAMTLEALEAADELLVVGAADPVGLSRLARGLVEVREVVGTTPVRVVVNRMRSSLGWSEADVAGMVQGFARVAGLHFLPDDRAGADRALVAGRAVGEVGESALSRAVSGLVDAVHPASCAPGAGGAGGRLAQRFRRRTAGTALRR
ncbi:AAA family ATPase [Nocardioides solisilvae]|uniref:AAA family ATPase n=1 Tax=Nocardioides solisilvae TaxID=1542435 RepID=UPI000D745ED5|nr:hypothetical protein [Nocardioides solisilvae]